MNKLDLLQKDGKADKGQSIHELEEDPNLRHSDTVQQLGQRRQVSVLAAVDRLEGDCAKRSHLFNDRGRKLVFGDALEHD